MRNLLIASFTALPMLACTGSSETPEPNDTPWVFENDAASLRVAS